MPISFKKAFIIVLILHGALYGVLKYRSYSARMAREARDREVAANYESNQDIWNNKGKKLRVLAVPKPKIKKEEKSFKDYFVDRVAYVINGGREFYGKLLTIPPKIDYEAKDTLDKIEKKINPPVRLKPAIKPKPIPSPTPFRTVVYRHTRGIEQEIPQSKPKIVKEEMVSTSVVLPVQSSVPRLRLVRPCPPPNFN